MNKFKKMVPPSNLKSKDKHQPKDVRPKRLTETPESDKTKSNMSRKQDSPMKLKYIVMNLESKMEDEEDTVVTPLAAEVLGILPSLLPRLVDMLIPKIVPTINSTSTRSLSRRSTTR